MTSIIDRSFYFYKEVINLINLIGVTKEYKLKNKTIFKALTNIDLFIERGESVGIVGYSGAGKSTLLRMMNGLVKPTEGKVIINGHDLSSLNNSMLNKLRYKVAMVFQGFNLLNQFNVFNNIKLALKISGYQRGCQKCINQRVNDVIELVGLTAKKDAYPKTLSGGEKQRVGIARAIANNPDILLLDEITSALDQKTTDEVVNLILKIKQETNVTVVFISHQIDVVAKLCQRVLVVDNGEIIENNETKEIFIKPKTSVAMELINSTNSISENEYFLIAFNSNEYNIKNLYDLLYENKVDFTTYSTKRFKANDEYITYLYLEINESLDKISKIFEGLKVEVSKYEK